MTNNHSVNYQLISSIKSSMMELGDQAISIANKLDILNPMRMEYLLFAQSAYKTCGLLLNFREAVA